MSHPESPGLPRSRRELAAARLLADEGFRAQTISRAYFAAFYAADAALQTVGESHSKHAGVIAAFIRLLVRDRGVDPEVGRLLRSLFERRNEADYTSAAVSSTEAGSAIADVERVVASVAAWMESEGPYSQGGP